MVPNVYKFFLFFVVYRNIRSQSDDNLRGLSDFYSRAILFVAISVAKAKTCSLSLDI